MRRPKKKPKLPKFKSIEQMAQFWDTHSPLDFESEFEEVKEPVFVRRAAKKSSVKPRKSKSTARRRQQD